MTEFRFGQSYVGLAYEIIDHLTHKWVVTKQQWTIRNKYDYEAIRNTARAARQMIGLRDDCRNPKGYWSPDGTTQFPVDSIEEAFVMHESRWVNDQPVWPQYVIISGSPLDGFEVIGVFATATDAEGHAEHILNDSWWVAEVSNR